MAVALTAGLLLISLLLLASPRTSYGCSGPPPQYDCDAAPEIAVGGGGYWAAAGLPRNEGDSLYATCPEGLTGPYVVCQGSKNIWSELKGPTSCPRVPIPEEVCPSGRDDVEVIDRLYCYCKPGYERVSGELTSLVCQKCPQNTYSLNRDDRCRSCPATTVSNSANTACECPGGYAAKPGTSWNIPGTASLPSLECEACPAGYYSKQGDKECSPCRGYYSYSTASAAACSTCPPDSYANAQHTGCVCNPNCTATIHAEWGLTCTCPDSTVDCGYFSDSETTGSSCQCKAGFRQIGAYDKTNPYSLECRSNLAPAASLGCTLPNQYTLAGDTTCRTCPANSRPFSNKDGCMCNAGYIPAAGTQSRLGNLQCTPCPAGTYARGGDFACTPCFDRSVSGAAAGECIECGSGGSFAGGGYSAAIVANPEKTKCYCSVQAVNNVVVTCSTYPNEEATWNAKCSCSSLKPPTGQRRLHSFDLGDARIANTISEPSDMETLISISTLQGSSGHSGDSKDKHTAATSEHSVRTTLEPLHITPTLNINGKPAAVLPMEVLRTTWEGRDATDVAACLSGALLTTSNVSLLAPRSVMASLGMQGTAAALADDMLSQLMPQGGSAAVFTSSMYKRGPRLSAKELKAALVRHYARLLPLPSCLRVPQEAAHRVRVALSNLVGMTTGTASVRGGEVADVVDGFTGVAELSIGVDKVVNEKHPELCAGIEGNSFRLRFAGFGGASSLSAATPNHIWLYVAVAEEEELCSQAPAPH